MADDPGGVPCAASGFLADPMHRPIARHCDTGLISPTPRRRLPVACGRDAADIAFLTTQGSCRLVRQSVGAEAI